MRPTARNWISVRRRAGRRAAGIDQDQALQDDVDGQRHDDRRHAEQRDAERR